MLDENVSPLADLVGSDGADGEARTDENGVYQRTGLLPGSDTETTALPGYSFAPTTAEVVVTDGDATQDFTGTALRHSLFGTFLAQHGSPLADVAVCDGADGEARTDEHGVYQLPGLLPGRYNVMPTFPG